MRSFQFLKVEVDRKVATLSLNNPKKANAMNKGLWFEIGEAFQEIDQKEEILVCVLKGEGKHFSAGIDLHFLTGIMEEGKNLSPDQRQGHLYQTIRAMQDSLSAVQHCRKPVIAAIHGVCIGGALNLVAACDFRYSTKLSVFGLMETRLGIVADVGALQRLRFTMPEGHLKELAFTSRLFRGYQAERWGLVNRSFFTKASLYKEVEKVARTVASLPAYAVQGTKITLDFGRDHKVQEGLEQVAALNAGRLITADANIQFETLKASLFNRKK